MANQVVAGGTADGKVFYGNANLAAGSVYFFRITSVSSGAQPRYYGVVFSFVTVASEGLSNFQETVIKVWLPRTFMRVAFQDSNRFFGHYLKAGTVWQLVRIV